MQTVRMKLVLTHLMIIQDKLFYAHRDISSKEIDINKDVEALGGLKLNLSLTLKGDEDYIDELAPTENAITDMLYAVVGKPDKKVCDEVTDTLCDLDTEPEIRAERIMKLFGYTE